MLGTKTVCLPAARADGKRTCIFPSVPHWLVGIPSARADYAATRNDL